MIAGSNQLVCYNWCVQFWCSAVQSGCVCACCCHAATRCVHFYERSELYRVAASSLRQLWQVIMHGPAASATTASGLSCSFLCQRVVLRWCRSFAVLRVLQSSVAAHRTHSAAQCRLSRTGVPMSHSSSFTCCYYRSLSCVCNSIYAILEWISTRRFGRIMGC